MGISAAVVSAVAAVGGVVENRNARKSAARNAAVEQRRLADLQNEAEPVVPVADDEAIRKARRRSISAQMRRRGRASTILTGSESSSDALGA